MPMRVDTRNPKFAVRFITQRNGVFEVTETDHVIVEIRTQKRMGLPLGTFQLALVPRAVSRVLSFGTAQWQDVIAPMDYCEIMLSVPPRPPLIPVMRGFITSVGEQFGIGGGQPQRLVIISGMDYGKLLIQTKLYYTDVELQQAAFLQRFQDCWTTLVDWGPSPELLPAPLQSPLGPGQQTDGATFTPAELLELLYGCFYKPQEDEVVASFGGLSAQVATTTFESRVDGWEQDIRTYNPFWMNSSWAPFVDCWSMMRGYQHAPWRELFFREYEQGPVLVYRPTPWLDKGGTLVQPTSPESNAENATVIPHEDIESASLHRSDAEVRNFFFTYNDMYGSFAAAMKTLGGGLDGFYVDPYNGNPFLLGAGIAGPATIDGDYRRFGFRLYEARTPYFDWSYHAKRDVIEQMIADARVQGLEGTDRLVQAYDHNELLESGSVTIKGNETIHIGDYVKLPDRTPAGGNEARFYAEGVSHYFRQGTRPGDGRFITTLGLTRGRGHLVRTQQAQS
jgi:hypothetical protein